MAGPGENAQNPSGEIDVPPGVTRIIYLPPRAGGRSVKDRLLNLASMLNGQGRETYYAAPEGTLTERARDPDIDQTFPADHRWVIPSLPAVAHTTQLAQVALDSFQDPDLYTLGESYFQPEAWQVLVDPAHRGRVTVLLEGIGVQGPGLEEGLIILDRLARLLRFEVIIVA
jgi:hypothetical protein